MLAQAEGKFSDIKNLKRQKSLQQSSKTPVLQKGIGESQLDPHLQEIKGYLNKGVTKANIAKIYCVSWRAVDNFVKTRGLGGC